MKWLIVRGNPVIGFTYWGPFDDSADAVAWADENITVEYDWWLTELETPKEIK
jgi:hypothetical protein